MHYEISLDLTGGIVLFLELTAGDYFILIITGGCEESNDQESSEIYYLYIQTIVRTWSRGRHN